MNWWSVATVAFFTAATIAWALSRPVARLAVRCGLVDHPGERKIHGEPVALLGGAAVWGGWVATIVAGYLVARVAANADPSWLSLEVRALLPGLPAAARRLAVILLGATLMLLLGIFDDRNAMRAGPKLLGQIAVACLVAASGVRVTVFLRSGIAGFLLTVLWIVTIVNAFNFFDNMDGLCTGTGAICAGLFAWIGGMTGQYFVCLLSAALAGALIGFLPHNMNPARMFLGDAGSHFVGFALAVIAVLMTFYEAGEAPRLAILVPVIVLSLPLFDLASVVWIRWREGRPIHQGDTRHLSHRFLRLGFSQRVTAVLIYLMTLSLGSGAVLLIWAPPRALGIVVLQIVSLLTMVSVLQYYGVPVDDPGRE